MRTLHLDGDRMQATVSIPIAPNVTALRRVPYELVKSASGDCGQYDRDYKKNQMTVRILDAIRKRGGA